VGAPFRQEVWIAGKWLCFGRTAIILKRSALTVLASTGPRDSITVPHGAVMEVAEPVDATWSLSLIGALTGG
jgi:hypothetical protein